MTLQVIKAEDVRAGEPRLWIERPQDHQDAPLSALHRWSRRDVGCQSCEFAIVDRPAPDAAPADHLATVRNALAVNPSHLIAPSITAVCDELDRVRHEAARLRRLITIDPGTYRDCRDCGGAGGFDFPRSSVNGGVTRLDCPTCVRRVMREEVNAIASKLDEARELLEAMEHESTCAIGTHGSEKNDANCNCLIAAIVMALESP